MNIIQNEMENEIVYIISTISEINTTEIKYEVDLRDALGIDSMMGLEIMYAVEKKFKIHLKEEDLLKMRSVASICALVTKHLHK